MQSVRSIDIQQLKKHTTEIVRQVRDQGVVIDIIDRGQVVAQLLPVGPSKQSAQALRAIWMDLDQLAAEIGTA